MIWYQKIKPFVPKYANYEFYAEERKCVEVIGNIFDNPELLEA